jgi:hypothetical protein
MDAIHKNHKAWMRAREEFVKPLVVSLKDIISPLVTMICHGCFDWRPEI